MTAPDTDQTTTNIPHPPLKEVMAKVIILVVLGVLLGVGHGWASSRFYGPERVAGFHTGMIEGFLMPAALPALLMGKDLPIYASNNTGRGYNIGFLFGINCCGTLFFGIAFWPSRKR